MVALGLLLGVSVAGASWVGGLGIDAGARAEAPVPRRARRMVSTTLETDEILLALVEPARIAAVTPFADDPAVSNVVRQARRVRGRVKTDPEPIVALRPDLVFVAPFASPESTSLLREAGIAVVPVPFSDDLESVRARIRVVGDAANTRARADELVREMDARIARVRARIAGAPRPRVLLWTRGGFTAGAGTLAEELLRLAGARCAAAEHGVRGHVRLDLEAALAIDPEVILVNDWNADAQARDVAAEDDPARDPAWRGVRAVRTRRVHRISPRVLLTTSHHVAGAVEALARAIHPERFR